jgi:hypothetical protein
MRLKSDVEHSDMMKDKEFLERTIVESMENEKKSEP